MFDSVRFLSNLSTGHMGYEVAKAAVKKRHRVTLVSGPTALKPPAGVKFISITSARDLEKACRKQFPKNDVLIMSAAVCDFTPEKVSFHKIRRTKVKRINLKQTPDIVAGLSKGKGKRLTIGFSLETKDWIKNAKRKCVRKGLDGIVANHLNSGHRPFGAVPIKTALVEYHGDVKYLPRMGKRLIAERILRWVENIRA